MHYNFKPHTLFRRRFQGFLVTLQLKKMINKSKNNVFREKTYALTNAQTNTFLTKNKLLCVQILALCNKTSFAPVLKDKTSYQNLKRQICTAYFLENVECNASHSGDGPNPRVKPAPLLSDRGRMSAAHRGSAKAPVASDVAIVELFSIL